MYYLTGLLRHFADEKSVIIREENKKRRAEGDPPVVGERSR